MESTINYMTADEIRFKFYSKSTKFYGTMYGGPYGLHEWDKILKIDKKDIKFCKDEDAFYYVWGWPGPDINIYSFEDYGKTWAFRKRDFRKIGRRK